jgi:hypothetical protein
MREARLHDLEELEEMAAGLLATALQLPQGRQRDDALLERLAGEGTRRAPPSHFFGTSPPLGH